MAEQIAVVMIGTGIRVEGTQAEAREALDEYVEQLRQLFATKGWIFVRREQYMEEAEPDISAELENVHKLEI